MIRHLTITWLLLLCVAASACGPTPTSLPSAPTAALVSATPTGLPPTRTPVATPQPTLEPVTSRFLYVQGVTVSTLAGDGHRGYRDGPASQARFNGLGGVAVDSQGDVYVTELLGNRVRRITSDGTVSTLAGTGAPGYADGPGSTAQFSGPQSLDVDDNETVYVADSANHCIRLIHPDGTVSTLAGVGGEAGYRDGPAAQAQFYYPAGVAVDAAGVVYVADSGNNRIRAISPEGAVTTLAGSGEQGFKDGPPEQAQFDGPSRLTVGLGGNVYAVDSAWIELRGNHAVRHIAPDGTVTTLAGTGWPALADGAAAEVGLYFPEDVAVDAAGNVYVADSSTGRIRVITSQGMVYTLAGNGTTGYADGPGPEAVFFWPYGIALDGAGHLYVTEFYNRIRVIHLPQTLAAASPSPTPDPYAKRNVIKIGFVANPGWAHLSAGPMLGAQLAVEEANAAGGATVGGVRHTFALVTAQDWFLPPGADAQAAARALLAEGVVAVVGHIPSEASMAAAEVYGPAGVVMVSPASSDPRLTEVGWSTVYRVTPNDAYLAPTAARMTYEELGIRRAVLLGEVDPHVQTAMDAWQQAFESLGGQVVGRFETEVEFPADAMAQLKALAPEAVILFPARRLTPNRAVQQVRETGVEAVIVGVETFVHLPPFLFVLGDAAEGAYDTVTGRPHAAMPGYAGFAERYRQASTGILPDPDDFLAKWTPFGYDATGVIMAAVRQAAKGGEVTQESVAAAMETFRREPYQGVTGVIQFDEHGDLLDQSVYFKKVVNGQWVDVMPRER
jgi:ABC-type branched-subunit amino acid transport system substrate-binding protein/sugar lactone lactonase YvrE